MTEYKANQEYNGRKALLRMFEETSSTGYGVWTLRAADEQWENLFRPKQKDSILKSDDLEDKI